MSITSQSSVRARPGSRWRSACSDRGRATACSIDRADEVAASWRTRYDRLKLNTGRPFSHLPDRPYPRAPRCSRPATRSSSTSTGTPARTASQLRLSTDGRSHRSGDRRLAAAAPRRATSMPATSSSRPGSCTRRTSRNGPGADGFTGELLHSSEYRNPDAVRGPDGCWSSARARRGWRSRTTSRRAGRPRSGWRSAHRRTSCCAAARRSARRVIVAAAVPRADAAGRRDRPGGPRADSSAT